LERALLDSRTLRLEELSIIPGKQCWIIHVDATVLDSGGNLLDAIVLATRAALKTTSYVIATDQSITPVMRRLTVHLLCCAVLCSIPAVTVVGGDGGEAGSAGAELEIEVSDDPFESKPIASADDVPVTVTLTKVSSTEGRLIGSLH
jgi:exosome complex component RRP42